MKTLSKYVQLLEAQLALTQKQLAEARKDIELYRGKCERLELAVMTQAAAPAAAEYVARTDAKAPRDIRDVKLQQQTPPRIPFSDIKRRWNALSAEQQEKAIEEGWNVDAEPKKEEANAGQ
jgi:hypothetical protein